MLRAANGQLRRRVWTRSYTCSSAQLCPPVHNYDKTSSPVIDTPFDLMTSLSPRDSGLHMHVLSVWLSLMKYRV